jgi:dipeptidyl aminopeptidase/acylaminoacyl peptidase
MRSARLALALILGLSVGVVAAQSPPPAAKAPPATDPNSPLAKETYLTPPKVIADAVLAGRSETRTLSNLSPDGRKFLITKSDGLPPVSRLGCPCVHLAEMTFDPVAGRARDLWVRSAEGFDLFFPADRRTVPVEVPAGTRVAGPAWSPDGSQLAFFGLTEDATHIYVADTETGRSRQVTKSPVLATLATSFQWSKDGKRIQAVLRPEGRWEAPRTNGTVDLKVRIARDGANPSRTYRYLLESPADVRLLEFLITGQLAIIDVADGSIEKVGSPAMIRSVSPAPGEKQFRVQAVKKPFSYYVPFTRFGSLEAVWDAGGKTLATLADRNLRESEPQPPTQPTPTTGPARFGAKGARPTTPTDPPTDPTPPPPGPDPDPDARPRFGPPEDPDGKRSLTWRPDGTGMTFLQLEPASTDAKKPAAKSTEQKGRGPRTMDPKSADAKGPPRKDRVLHWLPPFGKDDVKVVYETPHRIQSAQYTADGSWLFLSLTVDGSRQIVAVDPKEPKKTHVVYTSSTRLSPETAPMPGAAKKDDPETDDEQPPGRGFGARAGAGGVPSLLTKSIGGGLTVVRVSSSGDVYVSGSDRSRGPGSFPRPYIDRVNIQTGKKERIFEGKGELTESVDAVDGDDITRVFTTRPKADVIPDSFMVNLSDRSEVKLTENVDRNGWHRKLKVERFQVTRADGFRFWVRVTLPPDAKGKLPALFWIYPREYTDQAAYNAASGRNPAAAAAGRYNPPGPRAMTLLTLVGYAVVEPDIPIVGPAGRMNDNYIPDLRNSLWAVIDECDRRGLIDRDRLACGGHSYGAFSTANALAHTPFFKAGIAGDGNYNRTLTAMSFQTERRHLWDAREIYLEMSPLLWANRVNGALLMYHGMEDANVGTNPINAEQLFMALDGLGKPAALYMYPYEGHGPLAKETTLDLWARWVAWLDLYVKNPKKEAVKEKKVTTDADGE